ncbi:hypothetical protein AB8989_19270 [Yersinia hibernica]|uniref:hypothetical protein n=1 Tax=Yersinia hibernica TaxID=2339259 RepID=UPI00100EF0B8|nr:hypothetical protein [Yersinia hibernica]
MPNSLSVRDQNSFVSAYKNLLNENDSRIHKKDVNTLEKILSKCDKVEVGQLLMTKMESCPKDPATLENTFSRLFNKLVDQKSDMHQDKEDKLKNIQKKLEPVVKDIHSAKISSQIKTINSKVNLISMSISDKKISIEKYQNIISNADIQIKKLHDEIKPFTAKLSNTSEEEFAAKDGLRKKNTEAYISKLETKQNTAITAIKREITEQENSRTELLNFAIKHNVSGAESDLIRAESGLIFDSRDTGFGTTSWRDHLGSDKYAIKNFGYIEKEGRRQYSALTKAPNLEGRQWQKLLTNFNDAPKNINDLNKQLTQLKFEYKGQISHAKFENQLSSKQVIQQNINNKNHSIKSLEDKKVSTQEKINSGNKWISLQQEMKSELTAQIELLQSQLK